MASNEGLFDTVEVKGHVSGKQEGLLEKVLHKAEGERQKKVSRVFGEGWQPYSQEFVVTIHPTPSEENKHPEPVTKSADVYERALSLATQDGSIKYNEGNVGLEVTQTFRIPYESVPLSARGRDKKCFLETMAAEEGRLRQRHGSRMGRAPQEVHYRVSHYTGTWLFKGRKSKTPRGEVVGLGESNTSVKDAESIAMREVECYMKEHTLTRLWVLDQ